MKLLIAAAVLVLGFGGNAIAAPNFNVCHELGEDYVSAISTGDQVCDDGENYSMMLTDAYGRLTGRISIAFTERGMIVLTAESRSGRSGAVLFLEDGGTEVLQGQSAIVYDYRTETSEMLNAIANRR